MGMSSPKTKAEAREKIARLQGDLARRRARLATYRSTYGGQGRGSYANAQMGNMRMEIAEIKAKIAELRAKIPTLP